MNARPVLLAWLKSENHAAHRRITIAATAVIGGVLAIGGAVSGQSPASGKPPADHPAPGQPSVPPRAIPTAKPAAVDPSQYQAGPTGPWPVRPEPMAFEFGDMMIDSFKTGTVMLHNDSDQPIKILQTSATCSCTVPALETDIIPPHSSVPLTATFESPSFMGKLKRNVFVHFDGYPNQPMKLDINVDVNYGIRPYMKYLPEKQFRTGEFSLKAADGKPFRILSANMQPPVFADGFDPATEAPRSEYVLKVDLGSDNQATWPNWWVVETDHPTAPVIDLRVVKNSGRVKGPWLLMPERQLFWRAKPGETARIKLKMKDVWEDPVKGGAEVSTLGNDTLDVKIVGQESWKEGRVLLLDVTPKEGASGPMIVPIEVAFKNWKEKTDLIGVVGETPQRAAAAAQ